MYRKPNLFTFHPVNDQPNFAIDLTFTAFGWYYLYPPSTTTLVAPRLIYVDAVSLPAYIGFSTNLPIGCLASIYQPVGLCQIEYSVVVPTKLSFTHGTYNGRLVAFSQGLEGSQVQSIISDINSNIYMCSTQIPALLLLSDYRCQSGYPSASELAVLARMPHQVTYGIFNHHQKVITPLIPSSFFGLAIKGHFEEIGGFSAP
jgi:hypothetical protein